MKAMAGIVMECLLINGQSISGIWYVMFHDRYLYSNDNSDSEKYSKEDIDSLYRHLKEKRPHLLAALTSCLDINDVLLETGRIADGAGLDDFVERVKEALAADREEAAQDNYIWASMEWRWQEYANWAQEQGEMKKVAPNGMAENRWTTTNLYSQCLQRAIFLSIAKYI
jgi:hypothetical protein